MWRSDPTLTLIIANPAKPRRELKRDIAIIVAVQLVALVYGAGTLWHGRPLYYAFSGDRLEMVQASDLDDEEIARALRENPALAPHWYSRPRWVWAPLPDDPEEAAKIVNGAVFGSGKDVIDMPRYFRPWSQGLPKLREQLNTVERSEDVHGGRKAANSPGASERAAAPRTSATPWCCGGMSGACWWCSIPPPCVSRPSSGRNDYGPCGALTPSDCARNAHWSAKSSTCIHTGLPAPCPARVSMRIRIGLPHTCTACSAAANL